MRYLALAALAFPIVLSGCASTAAHGWSPRLENAESRAEQGARFVDFTYQDPAGETRSLDQALGDFTVLAFTKCESDTHQPVVSELQHIVANNGDLSNVKVVGVNIHWSETGCQHHAHCHLLTEEGDLGSICDASGEVHMAYGAHDQDWLIVIGPNETIRFSGPNSQIEELNRDLRKWARELSRERVDDVFELNTG